MKSILITGGSGSFGNAFVSHLLKVPVYERVVVYSRDEVKQAEMREKFENDKRLRFFLGDVRDKERLHRAFQGVDVVVHAAALKRIETCKYDPQEAVNALRARFATWREQALQNCTSSAPASLSTVSRRWKKSTV